jgi:hypothetical protein
LPYSALEVGKYILFDLAATAIFLEKTLFDHLLLARRGVLSAHASSPKYIGMLASSFNAKPEGYEPAPLEITRTLVTVPRYGAELPSDTIEPISWIEGVSEFTWYGQLASGAVDFIETVPQTVAGLRAEIINQNKDALLYGLTMRPTPCRDVRMFMPHRAHCSKALKKKVLQQQDYPLRVWLCKVRSAPLKRFSATSRTAEKSDIAWLKWRQGMVPGRLSGGFPVVLLWGRKSSSDYASLGEEPWRCNEKY